jgi:phosphoglycolate phosphatase
MRAGKSVSASRLDELQQRFLSLYAEDIAQKSEPFPGVIDTLKRLQDLGADLSVCTNKPGYLARPLLDELAMTHWFSNIVGGDEAVRAKPDPRHIFAAAGHRHSEHIVMVGDAITDMRAALNAGAYAVMMTYGYTHIPQKRLRADARLRRFRDLTPALMSWYAERRGALA